MRGNQELAERDAVVAGTFLQRLEGSAPRALRLERRRLRGGLEAEGVELFTARYEDGRGRPRSRKFVVKRLSGEACREAVAYEELVRPHASALAPEVLAIDRPEPQRVVLYLEAVRRAGAWPWRDLRASLRVVHELAGFHESVSGARVTGWAYADELERQAQATVEAVSRCREDARLAPLGRALPSVRRVAGALSRMREQLLVELPGMVGPIHGDVHPGNVVLRRVRGQARPVLLDWGRARMGSALEDLASWLHSLGYYEPEARRRHDTLVRAYLERRNGGATLASIRRVWWIAGASNALAGALLYHVEMARQHDAAPASVAAAADWLRILRRADAYWR